MPPWYIEKNIGIQQLQERSVAERRGDREDREVGRQRRAARQPGRHAAGRRSTPTATRGAIGTPDLIVKTRDHREGERAGLVGRDSERPDPASPRTATSRRSRSARSTTSANGGTGRADGRRALRVPSHDLGAPRWSTPGRRSRSTRHLDRRRPSAGRCTKSAATPTSSTPKSARLLKAGSSIVSDSVHLHSNGRDTKSHLEIGFKLLPEGLQADATSARCSASATASTSTSSRMKPTSSCTRTPCCSSTPRSSRSSRTCTRRVSAMCLEAIWGYNIQTLTCAGYDHNWVRGYDYDGRLRAAPAEGHDPAHHRLHGQLADQQERARPAQLAGIGQPLGREHVHRPRAARAADRRTVPGGDGEAPREAADRSDRRHHRLPAVQRDSAAGRDRSSRSSETAAAVQVRT